MRKTITLLIALVCFVFTLCFGQSIAVQGTIKNKVWTLTEISGINYHLKSNHFNTACLFRLT